MTTNRSTEIEHVTGPLSPDPGSSIVRLTGIVKWIALVLGVAGIALSINNVFNLNFFGLLVIIDTSFYYAMLGIFLSLVYLIYPAHKGAAHRVSWYDWFLFALAIGCASWLSWNGHRIVQQGWEFIAPPTAVAVALTVCLLSLEAVRRAGGLILFFVCVFFFLYPLFATYMPGFMWGPPAGWQQVATQHALGTESIIGLPMRVVTSLLIGFLLFGSALVVTGGGDFFMAFATALLGKTRGGPAKVSIVSSGFFGSLSGSVISNVVTTGQITIPTMKRTGYPASYAAAVEANASTGGALMPPVMGAVAFIMAEFLNTSYATIVIAALVPAVLFYLALLLQADQYAAKNDLKGQPASEIPSLITTLKEGWFYLLSLGALVYMLIGMRIESMAPYWATLILVVSALLFGRGRFKVRHLIDLLTDAIRNITNIVGILVGIGLIVGSLSYTGVGPAFSRELLQFAGQNVMLVLVLGAVTSFVLGMGMTVSACYIFLAIVMGQAVIDVGLNPIAGHLFILYWGMMSYITPPVAVAAVAAATIAKSHPMETGFRAMRLGAILFFLPFMFALNPTLILHGEPLHIVHDVTTAIVAVWMLATALEGWLYYVGRVGWLTRAPFAIAALAFLKPGLTTDLFAAGVLIITYVVHLLILKRRAQPAQ